MGPHPEQVDHLSLLLSPWCLSTTGKIIITTSEESPRMLSWESATVLSVKAHYDLQAGSREHKHKN